MKHEQVSYVADGATLVSDVYFEPGAPATRPGVLVAPEGGGLGEHARHKARRLAGLGYVTMAIDLYGDGQPARDLQHAMEWIRELTAEPARLRVRARAGLNALAAYPGVDPRRLAAIGFCFGGTAALELARDNAPVSGVVGFHCGLGTAAPAQPGRIGSKVLACIGAMDPLVPADQRAAFEREMADAAADWQLLLLGRAKHSFTNPEAGSSGWDALAYDPVADSRSWTIMHYFLAEALGRAAPA